MKEKIYLVCVHPNNEYIKLGKIYILKDQHESQNCQFVYKLNNLDNTPIYLPESHGYFLYRFKQFLDLDQAKFTSIRIKLGAWLVAKECPKINSITNYCSCHEK